MAEQTNKRGSSRTLTGEVVSTAMDKTVVVKVTRVKIHPKYRKRVKVAKKYHAHDPNNEYRVGDVVEIRETRPLSKTKRWRVVRKIN